MQCQNGANAQWLYNAEGVEEKINNEMDCEREVLKKHEKENEELNKEVQIKNVFNMWKWNYVT